jgi:hypothetical protein
MAVGMRVTVQHVVGTVLPEIPFPFGTIEFANRQVDGRHIAEMVPLFGFNSQKKHIIRMNLAPCGGYCRFSSQIDVSLSNQGGSLPPAVFEFPRHTITTGRVGMLNQPEDFDIRTDRTLPGHADELSRRRMNSDAMSGDVTWDVFSPFRRVRDQTRQFLAALPPPREMRSRGIKPNLFIE